MSESHALTVGRVRSRRRWPVKPPPRTPWLAWWAAAYMMIRFGMFYGYASYQQASMLKTLDAGVCCAVFAWDLWLHWRWRQWTRAGGRLRTLTPRSHPVSLAMEKIAGLVMVVALTAFDVARWLSSQQMPWEWWLHKPFFS